MKRGKNNCLVGFWKAREYYGLMDLLLTCCRNCSLKPALLGFFSPRETGGAAAAAAAGRVGNPD
jgi:hypothetical protein